MNIDINSIRKKLKLGILRLEKQGKTRREIADVTCLNLNSIDRILHKSKYPKIDGMLLALEKIKTWRY